MSGSVLGSTEKTGLTPEDTALLGRFTRTFRWGVATSALQIEGATAADGRGSSIWERFAEQPGAIERGEDPLIACDHYGRWREDVALIRDLGVSSYRFSIAWPRIQPSGAGVANRTGLAFYDRMVDALLEDGIRPFPTLYHWDLPQALEDAGGWANRDTAARFAEYAELVTRHLGDRLEIVSLLNEPFIFTARGYLTGRYAPGRRSLVDYLRAVHVVNLALAEGVRAVRAANSTLQVGSVFAMSPCEPASDTAADHEASDFADALFNNLFLDPPMRGRYPELFLAAVPRQALAELPGDEARLHAPLDFIGVNCYYRLVVSGTDAPQVDLPHFVFDVRTDMRPAGGHADLSSAGNGGRATGTMGRAGGDRTAMGWEVWPAALRDVLVSISRAHPGTPIEVCESGCAFDEPGGNGAGPVQDHARIAYHRSYIRSVADAIDAGAPVRSYHAWSLYDNFEWASGYRPRFGLVRVDFGSLRREPKASALWYREWCLQAKAPEPSYRRDSSS